MAELFREILSHFIGAGLFILVLIALARSWNKSLQENPPQKRKLGKILEKERALPELEIKMEIQMEPGVDERKKIIEIAQTNPERTANEIRKWLAEGKKKGGPT